MFNDLQKVEGRKERNNIEKGSVDKVTAKPSIQVAEKKTDSSQIFVNS